MKTLIVYDSTGMIWSTITGNYAIPDGLPYIEVEIPDGRYAVSVDVSVTPNMVILNEIPVDPIAERFKALEAKLAEHDMRIADNENLSWVALEGAANTYEAVLPFLPQ